MSDTLTSEELIGLLTAVARPLRLRVIAELAGGRVHVSELARRLSMSRPLLYMHLDRLEKAAVQFEADHPGLAASSRRLIDLLGKVGL